MEQTTLTAMREARGIRIADIITKAHDHDPDFPSTHAGYLGIEENGTRDYWKIKALSAVFSIECDALANLLRPSPRPKKM